MSNRTAVDSEGSWFEPDHLTELRRRLPIIIVLVIVLIIRFKVDPVISLVLSSLYLGLATGVGFLGTIKAITTGFGEIMTKVGLLIGFGVLMWRLAIWRLQTRLVD